MLLIFLIISLASLLIAGAGRALEPEWANAPQAAIVLNMLLALWGSAAFTYELIAAVSQSKRTHDYTQRRQPPSRLKVRWLAEGLVAALTLLLPLLALGAFLGWGSGWILGSMYEAQATTWIALAYLFPLTLCSLPMLTFAFASLRQFAAELYGS